MVFASVCDQEPAFKSAAFHTVTGLSFRQPFWQVIRIEGFPILVSNEVSLNDHSIGVSNYGKRNTRNSRYDCHPSDQIIGAGGACGDLEPRRSVANCGEFTSRDRLQWHFTPTSVSLPLLHDDAVEVE